MVLTHELVAPPDPLVEAMEGLQRDGGMNLGHPGVEAHEPAVVVPRIGVVSPDPALLCQEVVVRGDDASLGGHQDFGRRQAEHLRISERTEVSTLMRGTERVRRIIDHSNGTSSLLGSCPNDCFNFSSLGGQAIHVNWNHAKNIFVLGLIARIFDLDVPKLSALIKERFGGKSEDLVRNAMLGFDLYSLYLVGRIDRPQLEKYFDQAEYWLRSRTADMPANPSTPLPARRRIR